MGQAPPQRLCFCWGCSGLVFALMRGRPGLRAYRRERDRATILCAGRRSQQCGVWNAVVAGRRRLGLAPAFKSPRRKAPSGPWGAALALPCMPRCKAISAPNPQSHRGAGRPGLGCHVVYGDGRRPRASCGRAVIAVSLYGRFRAEIGQVAEEGDTATPHEHAVRSHAASTRAAAAAPRGRQVRPEPRLGPRHGGEAANRRVLVALPFPQPAAPRPVPRCGRAH